MTENQFQNLKKRIGAHPNLDRNGPLLHMTNPIGGFNEWVVLTYNLQVLGDKIKENTVLREKLDDVVDNYVKHLETLCKIRPPEPTAYPIPIRGGTVSPYPSDAMPYWIATMNQRLEGLEKSFRKMEELMMEKHGA
ncbi:hypothetical protein EUGRSUZ_C03161 [Eucalyptus grandis]|uniref:Uncharacterized protein n=2 Tax=Eucalyptus grandis TaxID=71139 RepID=A0ACC3LIR2_EUCGR|nr:hypothetical protein EUGRSUZ_C03161 [Eucalyptus grandis]